jgi:urease accessory protein
MLSACAGLALSSGAALAHTGLEHVASFSSGFLHPLGGLDHVLAMVAVGLWAGLNGGRAVWAWPAAFVGVMLIGGALGMADIGLPAVEAGIITSIIVLGLLVLARARLPLTAGGAIVAAFAVLHGHAHGAELPAAASAITYAAGFALATSLLHAAGVAVALVSAREGAGVLTRGAGALVALGGIALAFI